MPLPALEQLLPIAAPMLWLDEIVAYEPAARRLTCKLTLRSDRPFVEAGAIPALYALESMAQAAHALHALSLGPQGKPAIPQLLASVEEARFDLAAFSVGDVLTIHTRREDDGSFSCSVRLDDRELTTARLRLSAREPAKSPR